MTTQPENQNTNPKQPEEIYISQTSEIIDKLLASNEALKLCYYNYNQHRQQHLQHRHQPKQQHQPYQYQYQHDRYQYHYQASAYKCREKRRKKGKTKLIIIKNHQKWLVYLICLICLAFVLIQLIGSFTLVASLRFYSQNEVSTRQHLVNAKSWPQLQVAPQSIDAQKHSAFFRHKRPTKTDELFNKATENNEENNEDEHRNRHFEAAFDDVDVDGDFVRYPADIRYDDDVDDDELDADYQEANVDDEQDNVDDTNEIQRDDGLKSIGAKLISDTFLLDLPSIHQQHQHQHNYIQTADSDSRSSNININKGSSRGSTTTTLRDSKFKTNSQFKRRKNTKKAHSRGQVHFSLPHLVVCQTDRQFRCLKVEQCVSLSQRCDGKVHCADGSDELDCLNETTASTSIGISTSTGASISTSSTSESSSISNSDPVPSTTLSSSPLQLPFQLHTQTLDGYQVIDVPQSWRPMHATTTRRTTSDHLGYAKRKSLGSLQAKLDDDAVGHEQANDIHYAHIVHNSMPTLGHRRSHPATIRIGLEERLNYVNSGLNSFVIAILFGLGVTGTLLAIVSHKMRTIRRRISLKQQRRSLVPDTEFLIKSLPN